MYIEPNTTIVLLKNVDCDPSYENTMYFDNVASQNTYFESTNRVIATFSNNSYQRSGRNSLKIGWVQDALLYPRTVIADLYNAEYMRFKNTNFENKWFYAFVDRVEYINNNTVEVFYTIDPIQTWFFEFTSQPNENESRQLIKQCMIERTHTKTDRAGEHTVPEQLETGPYISYEANYQHNPTYYSKVVVAVSAREINGSYDIVAGHMVPGRTAGYNDDYYTGVYYYEYRPWQSDTELDSLNDLIKSYNNSARINAVLNIFMAPYFEAGENYINISLRNSNGDIWLGDYKPRNRKLYTYPYNMLYVTNNQGNTAEYKYERFGTDGPLVSFNHVIPSSAYFSLYANESDNAGLVLIPTRYNGVYGDNRDEVLLLSGFPMCGWTYDAFKAWLSQNAGSLLSNAISLAGGWTTAITTPVTQAGITSLIGETTSLLGSVYDHSRQPPQAKGNNNANALYQAGLFRFDFYQKCITKEYAEIIDKYFDMYGYAVHVVDYVTLANRPKYTYVKTLGCMIEGNLPSNAKREIENIFDNGIRFWRVNSVPGIFDPTINDNTIAEGV